MKRAAAISVGILMAAFTVGIAQAGDPYAVGEKWTYKHDGDVPMRRSGFVMTGDRTREVVDVKGEGDAKRWMILELWDSGEVFAGTRAVRADKTYDRMEMSEGWYTAFKPAFPFEPINLKAGEEKTFESEFTSGHRWVFQTDPVAMVAKRLKDEMIKVPAGEFENCIHVESEETATLTGRDGKETKFVTKREQWFHPKVNGLVKEIREWRDTEGDALKGSSELKSYAKK